MLDFSRWISSPIEPVASSRNRTSTATGSAGAARLVRRESDRAAWRRHLRRARGGEPELVDRIGAVERGVEPGGAVGGGAEMGDGRTVGGDLDVGAGHRQAGGARHRDDDASRRVEVAQLDPE